MCIRDRPRVTRTARPWSCGSSGVCVTPVIAASSCQAVRRAGGPATASALLLAVLDAARLADPPAGAEPGQRNAGPPARRTAWQDDAAMTGVTQTPDEPHDHGRAVRVTRGQSIRMVTQMLVEHPQRGAAVGPQRRQHRARVLLGETGQGRGEHGEDPGPADLPLLSPQVVAVTAHRPGRRIWVRRALGGGGVVSSPAALRTWVLTASTSMRSLGVQSRMSQSAAKVSIDRRCGGWVTNLNTCSRDRWTPRSASGPTRSVVWNMSRPAMSLRRFQRIPIFLIIRPPTSRGDGP